MDIKKQAVLEYLTQGFTYRQLATKYGVSRSTINTWILVHQGIHDLPRNKRQNSYDLQQMKHSVYTIIILTFTFFLSCNTTDKKSVTKTDTVPKVDTFTLVKQPVNEIPQTDAYYSLANAKIDTATLKGKREFIMNHFLIDNRSSSPDCDTLFDLNFDGQKDYVIRYYGQAGNGIKNRIQVFLYNKKNDGYIFSEQLSALPNPTFYIKQKKITSFYIAGHGSGRRLEWINGKWTETKVFDVDIQENEGIWEIEYPLTKKKEKIRHPFQMIPPKEILETDIKL